MRLIELKRSNEEGRIIIYFILFSIIILIFQFVPSSWLERITAGTTSSLLNFLGFNSGYLIIDNESYLALQGIREVSVMIIRECTAIHVWGVLVALVLPLYETSWSRKFLSLIIGGSLVFVMNISRIFLTVYLTAFNVPPFTWFFTNPTVETYHYPISFAYGVIGIAIVILALSYLIVPELGEILLGIPRFLKLLVLKIKGSYL
jgi:exosortase/archaeosortase family protein